APAPDGATHDGEVLGPDHHRPPVDGSRPGHDGVGRNLTHEGAELEEGTRVDELLDPVAGVELAPLPVARQALVTAHGPCRRPTAGEILEGGSPAPRSLVVGHRPSRF